MRRHLAGKSGPFHYPVYLPCDLVDPDFINLLPATDIHIDRRQRHLVNPVFQHPQFASIRPAAGFFLNLRPQDLLEFKHKPKGFGWAEILDRAYFDEIFQAGRDFLDLHVLHHPVVEDFRRVIDALSDRI